VSQAADRVYGSLRAGILDGRYGFGERLGEIEVAAALGTSRTPVREALRRLGSEGLVEVLPNRGARVRTWTAQDLEETYELRAVLEGLGARRAAARVTAAVVDELAALADEMVGVDPSLGHRPPGDFADLAALNSRFHARIVEAAGSGQLAATLAGLVQLPLVMRTYRRYTPHALARSHAHHHEIVDALRARDGAWAESVMRSHVLAARAVLLASHRDAAGDTAGDAAVDTEGRAS
jgi:DNA-binding GntR family transcriptional regulator